MIRVPSFNYCTIIIPSLSIIPSFNHSYTILIPLFVPWFYRCYTIIWPFIYHHSRIFPRPNRFLKGIGRGPSRLAAALGSPKPVEWWTNFTAPRRLLSMWIAPKVDRKMRNPRPRFLKLYVCFFLYIYIYIYIYYMLMYIYVNCLRFSGIAMVFLLGKGMMMDDVDRILTWFFLGRGMDYLDGKNFNGVSCRFSPENQPLGKNISEEW